MSQLAINFNAVRKPSLLIPLLFMLSTGGLLVLLIFGLLTYQMVYLSRVYPGVYIDHMPVGGLSPAEMVVLLEGNSANYVTQQITIQVDGTTHAFTAAELGLHLDAQVTANQAYAVGRTDNLLSDLSTHLSLLNQPVVVQPVITYDRAKTDAVLAQLAQGIDQPPRDAELVIQPDGQVELLPSARGRRLHVEGTRPHIERAISSQDGWIVTAVVQELVPNITEQDLAPAYHQAQNYLARPLTFGYQSDSEQAQWQLTPEQTVTMLNVIEHIDAEGKTQLTVEPNRERFMAFFEQLATTIARDPVDAQLVFDDEAGALEVLEPSQPGRSLDIEATYEQVTALTAAPIEQIDLPLNTITATISSNDLARLGVTQLITEATSYFAGSSQGRMNNIALAASKFDGVIIPPGEIFSFNEIIGDVTAEAGYDESLIIYGDRTAVGIGGGVCQVSTTVFRAAFYGGFELVERWAHGYRVGWYETNSVIGLDATIYTPYVDFKFRNDTEHFILIHTDTDLSVGTMTFRFYGTPHEREIIISEPTIANVTNHGPALYEDDPTLAEGVVKQVDWAKNGLDVTITRTVKVTDTVLHQDEVFSRYEPWRAVFKVGTGGRS